MIMSSKEKDKVWKEMVSNTERRVRSGERRVRSGERRVRSVRKELVSDLKLLVMVELVGCGLFVMLELLKY